MADSTQILDGFFKDVPIRIDSGSVTGGRKTVKKEFPNRDTQTVEDLGLRPRTYNVQIVVAPLTSFDAGSGTVTTAQGYFEYRDAIIDAIENKEPGELIHPLYGRITNVVATTYSISEDFSDFGRTRLNVTFEVSIDTGVPRETVTALSQLTQSITTVTSAIKTDITDNFLVINKFKNNFSDASSKITAIIDKAKTATAFLGAESGKINAFNSLLGSLTDDVNTMVSSPVLLATNINSLFSEINDLFSEPASTVNALEGFYNFGDSDEDDIKDTTAGRTQRKQNRAVLNGAVNSSALIYAYVSTAQISFDNVRDIEIAADALEEQYQRVTVSGASNDVIAAVTEMRVLVQRFFDEQKTIAKQITSVNVYTTPARILSYRYYGESETADQIIALNTLNDVSFVDGEIEILTK